jgi:hypothetical protein
VDPASLASTATSRHSARVFSAPVARSGAFIAALLVASLVSQWTSALIAAFVGGGAFAGLTRVLGERFFEREFRGPWQKLGQHVVAVCLVYALLFAVGWAWAAPRAFFCSSAVPWKPEIFAVGACLLTVLASLNRQRKASVQFPLIWIGAAWIAPWYGFFSISAVIGAGLALDCVGRDATDYLYLALISVPAIIAGEWFGSWLGADLPQGPINPSTDL